MRRIMVADEGSNQIAAAGEQPPQGPASPEFFFLVERMDRLEERLCRQIQSVDDKLSQKIEALDRKFTGEIKALDDKFTARIQALDDKFTREIQGLDDKFGRAIDNLKFWAIGTVVTVVVGFTATIVALVVH